MSSRAPEAVFATNLDALDPDTRQAVCAGGSSSEAVRVDAPPTGPVLSVHAADGRWVPAHSRRDPVAEAERWLNAALGNRDLPDLAFVIRPGLGYVIDRILARAPASRVVAIEPDPALARALLERRTWTRELQDGRLVLLCGPGFPGADRVWKLARDPDSEPLLVIHPVLGRLQPEATRAALEVARRIIFDAQANLAARRHFAGRYLLNTIENLPVLARTADVARLTNAADGLPAVVVGAGPSLDRSHRALAAVRDHAVLIAADTALRPLLAAGIEPDAAVAVDPGEANARHLLELPPSPQTVLACEGCLDPRVLRAWAPRLFTFKVSAHEPWPWLEAHGLTRHLLPAWGSVVTSAFELALLLGCDPIVFVGLDLAFTRGQPYARGVTFEEEWAAGCAWGVPLPRQWASMLARWPSVTLPDVAGGTARSAPHLVAFRDWLVSRAARAAGRRIVNATGAGILQGPAIEQADLERLPDVIGRRMKPRAPFLAAVDWVPVPAPLLAAVAEVAAGEDAHAAVYAKWEAFSIGRVSRARLREALVRAGAGLQDRSRLGNGRAADGAPEAPWEPEPAPGTSDAVVSARGGAARGSDLPAPERAALVRAGLSGEPVPDWALASLPARHVEQARHEFDPEALEEADAIVATLLERVRSVAWDPGVLDRDAATAASAPPSVLFDWPKDARSSVERLEELYAKRLVRARGRPEDGIRVTDRPVAPLASRDGPGPRRMPVVGGARSRRAASRQAWLALLEMWTVVGGSDGTAYSEAAGRLRHLLAVARHHAWRHRGGGIANGGIVLVRASVEARGRRRRVAALAPASDAVHAVTGLLVADGRPAGAGHPKRLTATPLLDVRGREARVAVRLAVAGGCGAAADPRRRLFAAPASLVPTRRLSGTAFPPAPLATVDPDGAAVVTPRGSRHSVRVTEGGVTPLEAWPCPIVGELQWEHGGARIAWSQAPVPRVLRRHRPGGPVIAEEVPFVPISVARLEDGRLVWTSHDGLWWWEPGRGGRRLHDLPSAVFVAREGGAWLVDPIPTERGRLVRRRERQGWWLSADAAHIEVRELPEEGQAWGDAHGRDGCHARAYPDADTIRLSSASGAAFRLACPWPRSVVWVGDSLLTCTSDGTVLVFERLAPALAGACEVGSRRRGAVAVGTSPAGARLDADAAGSRRSARDGGLAGPGANRGTVMQRTRA